jgi:hypothetical protein
MRLLIIILVLPLLTGCAYPVIWPYSSVRTAAVSGTLLDEHTRTPVSGADVFFIYDQKLHSKSDKDGRFGISVTRYHYWITWETVAGEVEHNEPPLPPEIMITHTNWATRQILLDQSPQTILLQKLPEPSDLRPWLTFDGNGVILQDCGAVHYLAKRPEITHNTNGTLQVIYVPFTQKVYEPHLTVLRGPEKTSFAATTPAAFSWSFWPGDGGSTNLARTEETSYIYRLEFLR